MALNGLCGRSRPQHETVRNGTPTIFFSSVFSSDQTSDRRSVSMTFSPRAAPDAMFPAPRAFRLGWRSASKQRRRRIWRNRLVYAVTTIRRRRVWLVFILVIVFVRGRGSGGGSGCSAVGHADARIVEIVQRILAFGLSHVEGERIVVRVWRQEGEIVRREEGGGALELVREEEVEKGCGEACAADDVDEVVMGEIHGGPVEDGDVAPDKGGVLREKVGDEEGLHGSAGRVEGGESAKYEG